MLDMVQAMMNYSPAPSSKEDIRKKEKKKKKKQTKNILRPSLEES